MVRRRATTSTELESLMLAPEPGLGEPRRGQSAVRMGSALLVASLLVGGGWYAAGLFQSPDQRAASATAPSPSPVVSSVQSGMLDEVITAQAQVMRSEGHAVAIPLPEGTAVVTQHLQSPGSALGAGVALLSVNDRPVFAIAGSFPAFRDLAAGDTGIDVRQLQDGLRAAGYAIARRENGTFGPRTVAAVRAMYKAAGFSVASAPAIATDPPEETGGTRGGEDQSAAVDSGDAAPAPAEAVPAPAETMPAPAETVPVPAETVPAQAKTVAAPAETVAVPASELLVVSAGLPAVLGSMPPVGAVLTSENAKATFVGGSPVATAKIAATVVARLPVGTLGELQVSGADPVPVTAAAVTAGDEATGNNGTATLTPRDGATIPDAWLGTQVLAELTLNTVGQESLIVPSRAVAVRSDGTAHVLKRTPEGTFATVEVHELGTLAGLSAVEPESEDALAVGDQVQVG